MLRTGKEYLESVRDERRVLCGGEWIDDITTHPKTRGYAHQVAAFYDFHLGPEHREHPTFDGPLVELARKVCDLGDIEELVRRADEERQKIIEIRDKPDYIKGQDVETV